MYSKDISELDLEYEYLSNHLYRSASFLCWQKANISWGNNDLARVGLFPALAP